MPLFKVNISINNHMNNKMNDNNNKSNKNIIPVVIYSNAYINKSKVYEDNKGKSGVYRLVNKKNNKSYVGSSTNLSKRFSIYYSLGSLKRSKGSIAIYNALLKHGHYNFCLDILEYCEIYVLIEREQYYIDLFNPEYNICKIAGSTLGFKHSEVTKEKIIISKTGIKHEILFSENLSKARRGKKNKLGIKINATPKTTTVDTRLKISERARGVCVKVFDKNNNFINQFSSMKSAANYYGVDRSTISRIFKTGISYDNYIYKFEAKDTRVWVYNYDYKLVKILDSLKKVYLWFEIPSTTIYNYIKSGKLYNKKYYFYNIDSKNNPYFFK